MSTRATQELARKLDSVLNPGSAFANTHLQYVQAIVADTLTPVLSEQFTRELAEEFKRSPSPIKAYETATKIKDALIAAWGEQRSACSGKPIQDWALPPNLPFPSPITGTAAGRSGMVM